MKKFFLTILMIIMIIPIGARALNASVDIGGELSGTGGNNGGAGSTNGYGLGNSYAIRFSLIKTENNSFDTMSTVYYIVSENIYGKPNGNIYISKIKNGTKTREQVIENINNYHKIPVSLDTFWVDTWGGNVKADAVGNYFNPNTSSGMENLSNLLAWLKVGSKVWNNSGYDDNGPGVKNVFNNPNAGCDKNDCNLDKLRALKNYIITIEPVFRFQDGNSNYTFATAKGDALWHHALTSIIPSWGDSCAMAKNVYSSYNGANPNNSCNVSYDIFSRPDNGYGMGTIELSDVVGNVPSCDNNTQCCYNSSGVMLPSGGGTHYKEGSQLIQCCDKQKMCCYSSPDESSYNMKFDGKPTDYEKRYKKVNGKFKLCDTCRADVSTGTCNTNIDSGSSASFKENSNLNTCTFDYDSKSGIKLKTGNNEVQAACRDEVYIDLPGKKEVIAGRYFVLDKKVSNNIKNLMPTLTIKRYCYAQKDSGTESLFRTNSYDLTNGIPTASFEYTNDTNSSLDILNKRQGSFSFSKSANYNVSYYDMGSSLPDRDSSSGGSRRDISSISNGNYVKRVEEIKVSYTSSSWVKALTGKVTLNKPNNNELNQYYESKDKNSIYVSYKTPTGTYNYKLYFDLAKLDNENVRKKHNNGAENKLFSGGSAQINNQSSVLFKYQSKRSNNSFYCDYKVKQKLVKDKKLNFFYRTVDLDNINHKNRKLGPNWSATKGTSKSDCLSKNKTKESKKSCLVQLDMKNKENSYKELTEQGDSYRFRLTPIDMKTIRKYNAQQNKNSDGFNDFNLEKYSYGNYKYDFYISRFLTCIYGKECKNLGSTLNNYLSNKEKNFNIDNIRNNLVKKLNNLEMDTGGIS